MSERTIVSLIVAHAANGVIGRGGDLPWHLPEDLKHFKAVTMGKPIVMGRKTYQSIGRALPGRQNIVITRDAAFEAEGCDVVDGFVAAIDCAGDVPEIVVIGGGEIYRLALPQAERIYITEIAAQMDGDTYFPTLDKKDWREVSREDHPAEEGRPAFSFVVLERLAQSPR